MKPRSIEASTVAAAVTAKRGSSEIERSVCVDGAATGAVDHVADRPITVATGSDDNPFQAVASAASSSVDRPSETLAAGASGAVSIAFAADASKSNVDRTTVTEV